MIYSHQRQLIRLWFHETLWQLQLPQGIRGRVQWRNQWLQIQERQPGKLWHPCWYVRPTRFGHLYIVVLCTVCVLRHHIGYFQPITDCHSFSGASTDNLPPGVLYKVKASYKYQAEDVDELQFDVGEVIQVVAYEDPEEQVESQGQSS